MTNITQGQNLSGDPKGRKATSRRGPRRSVLIGSMGSLVLGIVLSTTALPAMANVVQATTNLGLRTTTTFAATTTTTTTTSTTTTTTPRRVHHKAKAAISRHSRVVASTSTQKSRSSSTGSASPTTTTPPPTTVVTPTTVAPTTTTTVKSPPPVIEATGDLEPVGQYRAEPELLRGRGVHVRQRRMEVCQSMRRRYRDRALVARLYQRCRLHRLHPSGDQQRARGRRGTTDGAAQ